MTGDDSLSRRRLLRAGVAGSLAMAGLGTGQATAPADGDGLAASAEPVPELDLTEVADRTETATAAELPERSTAIGPGSMLFIERDGSTAGCTANFVWEAGGSYYLGAAGHCFLGDAPADEDSAEDGVDGDSVDGLTVRVCVDCAFGGFTALNGIRGETYELGDVVYARQEEPGGGTGVGHDFGLVEIPQAAVEAGLVDPSLPQFGGPTGAVDSGAVPAGVPVCQYGNGVGNGEVFATKGSRGDSLGDFGSYESWYAGIRASPGDSGSALLAYEPAGDPAGTDAAGVLTHLTAAGTAGTTIERCREMAREDANLDIGVVEAGGL